ncbi:MAG TPA: hypothetical protein P5243_11380, partial [Bacteroidales bacterium]|nr:hypothetical protein [Bacteroidales bacterium]
MKSICKFCLFLIFLISYSAYSQSEYISFFELPQSSQLKSLQTNTKKTLVELPFFDDFAKNSYVLS